MKWFLPRLKLFGKQDIGYKVNTYEVRFEFLIFFEVSRSKMIRLFELVKTRRRVKEKFDDIEKDEFEVPNMSNFYPVLLLKLKNVFKKIELEVRQKKHENFKIVFSTIKKVVFKKQTNGNYLVRIDVEGDCVT